MARIREFLRQHVESELMLPVVLTLLVVLVFLLPSLGLEGSNARLYSDVAFSLLLPAGVLVAAAERRMFIPMALVMMATLALRWASWLIPSGAIVLWRELGTVANVLLFSGVILARVVRAGPVTAARLQGAVAVYLLLGIGWANAYAVVELMTPGSFQGQYGIPASMSDWVYFSFVTLTTVGYGDLVPVHRVARSMAIGEALTGQIYIAVLLARLVSLEVSHRHGSAK